jgi:hypothetical protein
MGSPTIIWGIVLRTAGHTYVAGAVLGAVYSLSLYLALVLFASDGSVSPAIGQARETACGRYDPANIEALGLLGVTLGVIMVAFAVVIIGGFAGSLVGAISGAITGLVTGVLTSAAFSPITYSNRRQFELIISTAGIGITAALASVLGPHAFRMIRPADSDSPGTWLVQVLIPTLIAGLGAWWAGRRVAEWYEDEYLDSSATAG